MTWILYNIATGTVLDTDPTQPTGYSPDKAVAEVDFKFMTGQPVTMFRYNGTNIEPNTEHNIQLFNPFLSSEITAVDTKQFMELIASPELNQTVYVRELDASFKYTGVIWEQCGDETILREGLITEKLYTNNTKIG